MLARLSLRQRLALLVFTAAVLLLAVGWLGHSALQHLGYTGQRHQSSIQSQQQQAARILQTLSDRHLLLFQLRHTSEADQLLIRSNQLQGYNEFLSKPLQQYANSFGFLPADINNPVEELKRHLAVYNSSMALYQDSLRAGHLAAADRILGNVLAPEFAHITASMQNLNQLQLQHNASAYRAELAAADAQESWATGLVVAGVLLVLGLPVLLFTRTLHDLRRIQQSLGQLQVGDVAQEKLPEPPNEIGQISGGVNTVNQTLQRAANFATQVGQGQFDTAFEVASEQDLLGAALVEMRDRLKAVADEEARRNWAIAGFAHLGEILRAGGDLHTFADRITADLTRYVQAIQGAFFITQSSGPETEIRLVGCYAYDRKKYIDKTFRLGEGLVGQAAQEQSTIYITEVPDAYVSITSGLGEANPRALLVVPLIFNDVLYGVLEFAAFRPFPQHVVEFVEKMAENIASTLTNVRNQENTLRLLRETQEMSEQIRASEEELRQNMEELSATHEEMNRVQLELQGQVSALNNAAIVSEADVKGDILFVNDEFVRMAKYSRDELMGRNHRIVKSGHQEQAVFDELWGTISRGRVWKGDLKNRAKDGTYYWVAATITPVIGPEGKPLKYIGVRFDITEQKTQEEQIRQQLEEAQAQEEEMRQNTEELQAAHEEMRRVQIELSGQNNALNNAAIVSEANLRGEITFCNEEFVRVAKFSRDELIGQNHRVVKSGHMPQEVYEQLWATISKGSVWKGDLKNRAKDGSFYWVAVTITPVVGVDGKPVKYIGVRFDITAQKTQEEQIRQQLEEAQAQEEEMRQNAEELQAAHEEMRRVQIELSGQNNALNNAAIVSEANLRGEITFCNEEFVRIAKFSRDELIGQNHRVVKSGHMPQEVYEQLWAAISKGSVWKGDLKNRAKDGSFYWVAVTITPVVGADGKPVKYIGVRFDITAQKAQETLIQQQLEETRAQEEELRQNTEELEAAQEEMRRMNLELDSQLNAINNSTAVIEFDLDGTVLRANEQFLSVCGYGSDEVVGRHHRMFVQPEVAESSEYVQFWNELRSGRYCRGEFQRVGKGGKVFWIIGSYNPIMGTDGKPYKIVKFAQDVTEQKQQQMQMHSLLEETRAQEEELRQNAEELEAAQEEMRRMNLELDSRLSAINNSTAVIEFDLDGTILRANDHFLTTCGYTADEIVGRHHRMFVKPQVAKSNDYVQFWLDMRGGRYFRGEFERVGKNGKVFWIVGSYNPILGPDGKPYKVIKFAQDVTEQKLQQMQVQTLLEETRAQEEEIRQNAEEMQATQEELQRLLRDANQNELRFRMLASNVPGVLFQYRMEASGKRGYTYLSPRAIELFGCKPEAVVADFGNGTLLQPAATDAAQWDLAWERSAAQLKPLAWTGTLLNRYQEPVLVEINATPRLESDGSVVWEGILQEESAQQQTSAELAALRKRLSAIEQSLMVTEVDLAGNITYVNDAYLNVSGFSRTELLGQNHRIQRPEDEPREVYEQLWSTISNGEAWHGVLCNRRKDGSMYRLMTSIVPVLDENGIPLRYVGTGIAVTHADMPQQVAAHANGKAPTRKRVTTANRNR